MGENGRKADVIIEDRVYFNQRTGLAERVSSVDVWADSGMRCIIEAVEGVSSVFDDGAPRHVVYVDPRYDLEFVKREIEAAILCSDKVPATEKG